jgi:hypothetical protein
MVVGRIYMDVDDAPKLEEMAKRLIKKNVN